MKKSLFKTGASLTGYGLVVGLIAIVALTAVTGTGSQVNTLFGEVSGSLDDVSADGTASSAAPSAEPSASASPSPVAAHIFFNCPSAANLLVFADNVDGLSISNYTNLIAACQHYGFLAAGSSHTVSDQGFGTSDNGNLLQATNCHNCYWVDGGNPFYRQRSGSNCFLASGSAAPADTILAGAIVNSGSSNLNCATFKGEGAGNVLTPLSSDTNNPFYHATHASIEDEPNCSNRTNRTNGQINYTGSPDYILCATPSVP
ncbi:MAG: hypothetical protein Alpg2KO_18820 [Alphaproteobacteria bacterium]